MALLLAALGPALAALPALALMPTWTPDVLVLDLGFCGDGGGRSFAFDGWGCLARGWSGLGGHLHRRFLWRFHVSFLGHFLAHGFGGGGLSLDRRSCL